MKRARVLNAPSPMPAGLLLLPLLLLLLLLLAPFVLEAAGAAASMSVSATRKGSYLGATTCTRCFEQGPTHSLVQAAESVAALTSSPHAKQMPSSQAHGIKAGMLHGELAAMQAASAHAGRQGRRCRAA